MATETSKVMATTTMKIVTVTVEVGDSKRGTSQEKDIEDGDDNGDDNREAHL